MAKSAGAATKTNAQPQSEIRAANDRKPAGDEPAVAPVLVADAAANSAPVSNAADAAAPIDLNSFAKAREALEQQLKFWTLAIEDTGRSWRQFDEQVAGASSELVRLRTTEKDFQRLAVDHEQATRKAESLGSELAEVKARELAASDRAAKLEEICKEIKERALEIHMALQTTRANEQKLQAEVSTFRSELVELRRTAQEETAGRLAAEDRTSKLLAAVTELESVEAEARDRLAKVTQDNKAMAQQLPQLVADCNSWQKQFSASERENARMQAERQASAKRIGELEDEIRTLRADLGSMVGVRAVETAQPAETAQPPETAPPNEDVEFDDTDLVSSLDRAFAAGEKPDSTETVSKQPH